MILETKISRLLREGEVRSWWTASLSTTPAYKLADYTFTGQFSYMDDPSTSSVTEGFGLMFYNARWYDPALGRFAQADTVVTGDRNTNAQTVQDVANAMFTPLTVNYSETPILMKHNADSAFIQGHGGSLLGIKAEEKQKAKIAGVPLNSQVLDRYSYVLNNPLKFNDPSGYDVYGGNHQIGYMIGDNDTITIWVFGNYASFTLDDMKKSDRAKLDAFMRVADDYADMSIAIGKDIGGAGASLLAMLVTLPSCTTVVLCIVPGAAALVFVEQIGEGLVDVIKTKKMQDEAFSIFIQLTKPGTPGLGKVTLHD